jgi:hypothetical protein
MGSAGSDYWGAQDRSVPISNGSRPGAPPGGHSTKLPLPEDPVAVAAPAVEADPPPPRDPPETLPPAVPIVPVVVVLPPAPPPALPVVPVEVVDAVGEDVVLPAVEADVVVPTVGFEVVVDEFCTLGKAAAPPPDGNPLRNAALPTFPAVGVAVCARAAETRAIDRRRANPMMCIMAGYIMRQRPA